MRLTQEEAATVAAALRKWDEFYIENVSEEVNRSYSHFTCVQPLDSQQVNDLEQRLREFVDAPHLHSED